MSRKSSPRAAKIPQFTPANTHEKGENRRLGYGWLKCYGCGMNWRDLASENRTLMVIAEATIREAEWWIESCEHCNAAEAKFPVDWLLDRITGCDSGRTDYILEAPGHCPHCHAEILEKTLIDPFVP